jgi:endonuclease YncB( thermonuclease family)
MVELTTLRWLKQHRSGSVSAACDVGFVCKSGVIRGRIAIGATAQDQYREVGGRRDLVSGEASVNGIEASAGIVLIVGLVVLALCGIAFPDELKGQASVVDGDTLEVHAMRIRLWGIDAPESTQLCRGVDSHLYRCGVRSANDLDGFIARRAVSCIPVSQDQYGRKVARCSVDRIDLGEWLVRNGLALDWPQYSKGKYDAAQRDADHAGRGVWAGSYVAPWLYRVCIKSGGSPSKCSDDANAHP